MKYNSIIKMAVAIALLFTVNTEADAQLGKLKGLAKKAVEAVGNSTTTTPTTSSNNANPLQQATSAAKEVQAATETPEEHEARIVKEENYCMDFIAQERKSENVVAQRDRDKRFEAIKAVVLKKYPGAKIERVVWWNNFMGKRWGEPNFEDFIDWLNGNGLAQKHPEYVEQDVTNIRREYYSAYFVMDGKYYVVRSEYRTISFWDTKAARASGKYTFIPSSQDAYDPDWNPGIHTAVEVPADVWKQYFK